MLDNEQRYLSNNIDNLLLNIYSYCGLTKGKYKIEINFSVLEDKNKNDYIKKIGTAKNFWNTIVTPVFNVKKGKKCIKKKNYT